MDCNTVDRKQRRLDAILVYLAKQSDPIMIGKVHRALIRVGQATVYKTFSRDIHELILRGELGAEERRGFGGNTTLVWLIRKVKK